MELQYYLWVLMGLLSLTGLILILCPVFKKPHDNQQLINHEDYKAQFTYTMPAFMVVLFLAISLMGYRLWGNSKQLKSLWHQQSVEQEATAMMAKFKDTDSIIHALEDHLAKAPNSAKGWFLLGRLYLVSQRYENASVALAKANHLKPNSPRIMADYAQALFFINHRRLNKEAFDLLQSTLNKDPNNIDAINLLAINAYNTKQYDQALHYWELLLPMLEGHDEEKKTIMEMMTKARNDKIKERGDS